MIDNIYCRWMDKLAYFSRLQKEKFTESRKRKIDTIMARLYLCNVAKKDFDDYLFLKHKLVCLGYGDVTYAYDSKGRQNERH